jgi:hypothetical protein
MATEKMRKHIAKLKTKMAQAKKIHKAHPGKKWTTCVKEAWKK